jgi:hypothetical protein
MENVDADVIQPEPDAPPVMDATDRRVERKAVKAWQQKVNSANKAYQKWEHDYNAAHLEEYWSGIGQILEGEDRDAYVINMCHPSVEQRMPALMFHRPKFAVRPRIGRKDDSGSSIEDRCLLREDTLNTKLDDHKTGFKRATKLALRESHYRFGVVEVGYETDVAENPNAGKPLLDGDGKPMVTSEGLPLMQEAQILTSEQLWVRRIPAHTFRCSVNSHNNLKSCEWVGYFEWMYIEDLKASRLYQGGDMLKPSGKYRRDMDVESDMENYKDREKHQGMVKVWKVWSSRDRKKYVWAENHDFFLLEGQPFKFLPLALLKFYDLMDELYPVPVMYTWTSIQDELNETRNMQKIHRRRFKRRYWYIDGKIEPAELEKLRVGPDGTFVKVPAAGLIGPIEDAPLDRAVLANVINTREDFMYASGVSGEQRGAAESETATQAQIIDVNTRIRESEARQAVSEWLGEIAWIMLRTIEEFMSLEFWILQNVDPLSVMSLVEAARVAGNWKQIKTEVLGDLDFDVVVDIESLSPINDDQKRNSLIQFLGLLTSPGVGMLLLASPQLFKRVAALYNIRSDRELEEIKQALVMLQLMAMKAGGPGGDKKPGGGAKEEPPPGPGPTPAVPDIMQQLVGQLGMGGPRG